jgi:hypothetical protein
MTTIEQLAPAVVAILNNRLDALEPTLIERGHPASLDCARSRELLS